MTKLTVWALPHTKWRHYMEIITRNEKILYVGIDVHKDTYSLCCFDFFRNELSDEMTIKATTKAVIKYLESMRNIFIYCCCRPRKEIRNSGISATKSILSDGITRIYQIY